MTGALAHRAAVAMVTTAAAVVLAGSPPAQAQTPDVASTPGAVTAVEMLPASSWIPGAVTGTKVTYTTTGPLGRSATSTGAVFLPPGEPPPGGWPVVSWAHGTVGIADRCSPTVTGKIGGPYLAHWLSQGYAVVATDYVGLGTPGLHPYLDGPTEANSVIDMVRAARAVEPALSPRWIVLGQSQGGQAALFTAARATGRAPELDFRGAVATGAPSNLENLTTLVTPGFPRLPLEGSTVFVSYILAGLRAARPDIDVDRFLTPVGRDALAAAETECYETMAPKLAGVSIGSLVSRPLDDPALLAAVRDMLEVPTTGYDRPVFLGQGLTDDIVPAPLVLKLAAELTANRQPVTFRTYPTGHLETMRASLPETTAFVRDLFTR
ncbi:lipase family protein [Prescottella equi]|jgi:pimeloyl-ACP methyl ester carboxylesterase|uniref:lipase family protein n=1 Tax=Rhodococcus hoagii TaxID=43767 RepID=UPI0007CD5C6B|nr:lipase family protein [Prescottella equi]MBM4476959.1 lipase [Prescottella equi]MBM4726980.1 lipase [Prescottella equi]MDP8014684.1 lipase family protein [Prescottella equi]NKR97689.1 lipase [Prescottella equi]NKS43688.1 lipase [Prescottella equi]